MAHDSFISFFQKLFNNDFMPHGHCYFWRPEIVWLHVISDGLIAFSYYTIPLILLFFMFKRKDFPFPLILIMFGAFILFCGTTHLMSIITLWDPLYRLDGIIKAATAFISIVTMIMLVPLVPLALSLKSPKELEAANLKLAEANEKLTEIDRLKDNFFSNISHELRTPLTLLLAPLESFLANDYGPVSDIQHKNLKTMHNNSIRLFQMVNSILDFAKISAKKIEVKREPLDIVLLTQSIIQEFEPLIKQKNIQSHFHSSAAKKIVLLDRYLYERILFNLLSNALKFTSDQGSITISLDFLAEKSILTVTDTGIGISKSDQEKLFQRFQQVEGSATRRFEGTGLGLALVKEFSLLLGGDVNVKSEPGKGSTFSVEINTPIADAVQEEVTAKPLQSRFQKFEVAPIHTSEASEVSASETTDSSEFKILIAEDNLELATYMSSLLSEFSKTKHAKNGEEAWEIVKTWNPTLVILDVMMPKRDGLSVCKEIKSTPKTAHIPVVLLTALTHRDALVRGWEAGADEYLFKPFHPKELVTRIKLLLSHAQNNELLQEVNRKLIISARLAGMAEVATDSVHSIGNALNSVNVSANVLYENLSQSKIQNLEKLIEWTRSTFADPTGLTDRKKQDDFILYLNTLHETLSNEQKEWLNEVNGLKENIEYIKEIISLQQNMKGPTGLVEAVNLPELLEDAITLGLDTVNNIHVIKNYHHISNLIIDKMRLHQILVNLIHNAKEMLQDSPQENKELAITAQTKMEEGKEWLTIEISDNGAGINPEDINKIFNFGFTTKHHRQGFSLHLSFLSAQKMGGKLCVKSSGINAGTTFILKLPTEPLHSENWIKI